MDEIECFVERFLFGVCHLSGVSASIVEQDNMISLIIRMLLIDSQGLLHQSQCLLGVAL